MFSKIVIDDVDAMAAVVRAECATARMLGVKAKVFNEMFWKTQQWKKGNEKRQLENP